MLNIDKSIFEKIIDNDIPSLKVYEDDNYIAILDINPEQMGHTLLIPKTKEESIIVDSFFVKNSILVIATNIANKLKQTLGASGFKFIFNIGPIAGQVVFHTHLHIIPYYKEKIEIKNDQVVLDKILQKI